MDNRPAGTTRSSLEEMLESLKERDEAEHPKDLPPALPSRPNSRARRPSVAKRSLPNLISVPDSSNKVKKKREYKRSSGGSFGGKKPKEPRPDESPYASVTISDVNFEENLENGDKDSADFAVKSSSFPKFKEPELNENLGYFIKKVQLFSCTCTCYLQFFWHFRLHVTSQLFS